MEKEYADKEIPIILIVDDISMNVEILDNILQHEGYETLCATSVKEAIELMKDKKPSLVLSDVSMPDIDGFEFCRMLKSDPKTRDIPVIFITVLDKSSEKQKAFATGAVDFMPKPFDAVEVIMRVNTHLNIYNMKRKMSEYNRMLNKLVDEQKKQIEKEQETVLTALARLMISKNPEVESHIENIGYNAFLIAQALQFIPKYEEKITDEFAETIRTAAKLHDIGCFIASDTAPGSYPPKLWDMEYLNECSKKGTSFLEQISAGRKDAFALNMARRIVKYHYANWDGTGTPDLKGEDIPMEARIVALLDDFDNMIIRKTGETATSIDECISMINDGSGHIYDPDVVDIFNKIWRQLRINRQLIDNMI